MRRNSSINLRRVLLALLASAPPLVLLADCDGRFAFDEPPAVAGNSSAGVAGGTAGAGAGGTAGATALGGSGGMQASSAGHAGRAPGTCSDDSDDCGLPSLRCNPSTNTCVECVTNQQCPTDRPACSADTGRCLPCSATVACPKGQACDLQTNKCLTNCKDNSACTGVHQYCNHGGECVACDDNTNGECSPIFGGAFCQISAGVCVQCLDTSQCSGQTPLCLLPLGLCVACRDSPDCPKSAPYCDPTAHVCSAADQ
ncbi:MAG: hypothetical protein ABI627_12685 [Polyangiaceae bacterium]